MTDAPDLRQLSGFRTPLAAAMLSGVLAGAAGIIAWHIQITSSFRGFGGVFLFYGYWTILWFPYGAFLCSGPAIAQRSWKLAGWALLWAFGFSVLNFTWYYAPYFLTLAGRGTLGFMNTTLWGQTAHIALSGALLGFALTRLYGFRPYSKWAPLFGAIGGIATYLVEYMEIKLGGGWYSGDPKTTIPAHTMVTLLGSVVLVVLPTAAIEYSLRQQARAANPRSKT